MKLLGLAVSAWTARLVATVYAVKGVFVALLWLYDPELPKRTLAEIRAGLRPRGGQRQAR